MDASPKDDCQGMLFLLCVTHFSIQCCSCFWWFWSWPQDLKKFCEENRVFRLNCPTFDANCINFDLICTKRDIRSANFIFRWLKSHIFHPLANNSNTFPSKFSTIPLQSLEKFAICSINSININWNAQLSDSKSSFVLLLFVCVCVLFIRKRKSFDKWSVVRLEM